MIINLILIINIYYNQYSIRYFIIGIAVLKENNYFNLSQLILEFSKIKVNNISAGYNRPEASVTN